MKYYHVTSADAFHDHIKYEGLMPKIGERSQLIGETTPAVYLFKTKDEAEDAIVNWLGDYFDEDEILLVLEVDLPRAYKSYFSTRDTDAGEVICLTAISPVYIHVVSTEKDFDRNDVTKLKTRKGAYYEIQRNADAQRERSNVHK